MTRGSRGRLSMTSTLRNPENPSRSTRSLPAIWSPRLVTPNCSRPSPCLGRQTPSPSRSKLGTVALAISIWPSHFSKNQQELYRLWASAPIRLLNLNANVGHCPWTKLSRRSHCRCLHRTSIMIPQHRPRILRLPYLTGRRRPYSDRIRLLAPSAPEMCPPNLPGWTLPCRLCQDT